MAWNSVIGQQRVKELLRRSLESGRVAHAYLFHGIEGVGKDALAMELARTLVCERRGTEACGVCAQCRKSESLQHPAVHLIFALPTGKNEENGNDPIKALTEDQVATIQTEIAAKARDPYHRILIPKANFIRISSVRQMKRESALASAEGGRRVFVIFNADEMNPESSNSLLKTLEEPLTETFLLLTTSRREQLLPTIISRCQLLRCDPLTDSEIADALVLRDGVDPELAQLAARLANGSYGTARTYGSDRIKEEMGEVVDFLRASVAGKPIALMEMVERLSAGNEREALERFLLLLQTWLRDALLLAQTGRESAGNGSEGVLKNFVARFPKADLIGAQEAVETSVAHLHKNVYLQLVLLRLAVTLKRTIAVG